MLSFYKVFSSHAVLQRERPIVFYGYGVKACATLTATFAGKKSEVVAAEDGTWSVAFPAMAAGGPYELVVSCCGETISLEDLLVGEVWVCSGQSNMEMPLNGANPFFRAKDADAECAAANYPGIRLFDFTNLKRMSPDEELDDVNAGEWKVCTPESVYNFSAAAYFFGRKLHKDLNIPIGLISTSWGGTNIQAWISHDQFIRNHWLEYSEYLNSLPAEMASAREDAQKKWEEEVTTALSSWTEKFDAQTQQCPAAWLGEAQPCDASWEQIKGETFYTQLPKTGRYVVRVTVDVPQEAAGKEMTLSGMVVNDCDRTFINGVEIGATTPVTPNYWACVRVYTIKAGLLHAGKNILAVIADNHKCAGEVNMTALQIVDQDGNKASLVPGSMVMKAHALLPKDFLPRPDVPTELLISKCGPSYPSTLYNAMLYCFRRYAVRGAIWYQGCNNNGTQTYYKMHKMLIDGFRELWKDSEMPFIITQLASFEPNNSGPENRLPESQFEKLPDVMPYYVPYAVTREIQAALRDNMRNVGLACIFDAGDHSDIHPRDKQTVGARLALWAEEHTYGMDVKSEGPRFAGLRREGKTLRVFFEHAEGLKTTDGEPPKGFAVVTRNGEVVVADAKIDGNTVVVSSIYCQDAEAVRYAFVGFCHVNLVNGAGLPAEPFRSDAIDYERAFR